MRFYLPHISLPLRTFSLLSLIPLGLACALLVASWSPVAGATELLVDGGFEQGLQPNWVMPSDSAMAWLVSSPVHSGTKAISLTRDGFSNWASIESSAVSVPANASELSAGFWYYVESPGSGQLVGAIHDATTGAELAAGVRGAPQAGGWQRYEIPVDAAAVRGKSVTFRITLEQINGLEVIVDDASLRVLATEENDERPDDSLNDNGGFESPTNGQIDGWGVVTGTVEPVTDPVYAGQWAVRIGSGGAIHSAPFVVPVTATQVTYQFWYYTPGGTSERLRGSIRDAETGAIISTGIELDLASVPDGRWVLYRVTVPWLSEWSGRPVYYWIERSYCDGRSTVTIDEARVFAGSAEAPPARPYPNQSFLPIVLNEYTAPVPSCTFP